MFFALIFGNTIGRDRCNFICLCLNWITNIPVTTARARINDAATIRAGSRLQYSPSTFPIDFHRMLRVFQRVGNRNLSRLMINQLGVVYRASQTTLVQNRAFHQFNVFQHVLKIRKVAGGKIIYHTNFMSFGKECMNQMRSNKSGTTRNGNSRHQQILGMLIRQQPEFDGTRSRSYRLSELFLRLGFWKLLEI